MRVSILSRVAVRTNRCSFSWVCIDFVRLFSDFTAADFSSLTHLVINDSIRDMRRWAADGGIGQRDWQERGRSYVGIHELVSSLPQLRHLWVDERVFVVPAADNRGDAWEGKPFNEEPQEEIISRTASSPQWELLGRAFERLESLRVGLGPLNAEWVARVLSLCDCTKLTAFGFDWEWQPGSNKSVRTPVLSLQIHECID